MSKLNHGIIPIELSGYNMQYLPFVENCDVFLKHLSEPQNLFFKLLRRIFTGQGQPTVIEEIEKCYKDLEGQDRITDKDIETRVTNSIRAIGRDGSAMVREQVRRGHDNNFVRRGSVVEQLLGRVAPSAIKDGCQRTAVAGLGGIGKTQIALETAYCIRDQYPTCSVFWVPAIDATSFEEAYRKIGKALGVQGLDDNEADVKLLVKAALSHESASEWLLIVDNADDLKLFAGSTLADHLPFSRNGSILFTTRNHQVAISDIESTKQLLEFLTNLPLAIKQASSYMARLQISTTKYFGYCISSDETTIKLLSRDFEDLGRYKAVENPVATTWLISFNHIFREMPLAAQYLEYICFFAEKDIPISLLPSGKDELEVDEAIGGQGKYDEAETMHREVLALLQKVLGREHPDTLNCMKTLELVLNWQRDDETE
ncbi:putative kinesin light chain protein [Eutypa lata UCREL1]|uniref:Putative kinesin light chain protein n=1 Tax=Eutypa lata (strain UCR-EL1) TaxID=1287681 RepID=M7SGA6_EUTLA|nr:putative kinesin light chain protein [Eutypa lata UCREL1]